MRNATLGLALGLVLAATVSSQASAPGATDAAPAIFAAKSPINTGAGVTTGDPVTVASRDRGGDKHSGDRHNGKGGKDDPKGHDRKDDHGNHGPNHA